MNANMHRDGWTLHTPTVQIVAVQPEVPVLAGQPAFTRLQSPGDIGAWRNDSDEGRAIRVDDATFHDSADAYEMCRVVFRDSLDGWYRSLDDAIIPASRVDSGRYAVRAPTNRKRKRARCKGRRARRLAKPSHYSLAQRKSSITKAMHS